MKREKGASTFTLALLLWEGRNPSPQSAVWLGARTHAPHPLDGWGRGEEPSRVPEAGVHLCGMTMGFGAVQTLLFKIRVQAS